MTSSPPTTPEQELTFEDALGRLEKLVQELERDSGGLDDALKRYEEGVRMLARCQSILTTAERRVALLTGVDDNGQPATKPFVTDNSHDE